MSKFKLNFNLLKTTMSGSNKCCSECDTKKDTVRVPCSVRNKMLGLAMTLGGLLGLASCDPLHDDVDIPVTPVDTLKQTSTQQALTSMIDKMGLVSVSKSEKVDPKSIVRKGDVVELNYYHDAETAKYALKLNEAESTKDFMVYYGIKTLNGIQKDIRYTASQSSDGNIKLKKEVKINGLFTSRETFKFIMNADGTINQKQIMTDGSGVDVCKYERNNQNSLIRVDDVGNRSVLNDIFIVRK